MSKTSKALDLNLDTLISDMRQGAEDFCNSRAVVNLSCRDYQSAAEELERLRTERDEARVWWLKGFYRDWQSEAARRGWDCFKKEETPIAEQ